MKELKKINQVVLILTLALKEVIQEKPFENNSFKNRAPTSTEIKRIVRILPKGSDMSMQDFYSYLDQMFLKILKGNLKIQTAQQIEMKSEN